MAFKYTEIKIIKKRSSFYRHFMRADYKSIFSKLCDKRKQSHIAVWMNGKRTLKYDLIKNKNSARVQKLSARRRIAALWNAPLKKSLKIDKSAHLPSLEALRQIKSPFLL